MLASKNQIASLSVKKKNGVFSSKSEKTRLKEKITSQAEGDENPACRHMHFTYPRIQVKENSDSEHLAHCYPELASNLWISHLISIFD